jgi:ubiquinone biosynthesis protein Coq4
MRGETAQNAVAGLTKPRPGPELGQEKASKMVGSPDTERRGGFAVETAARPLLPSIADAAKATRAGGSTDALAAAFCHAAFVAPEHTVAIYDTFAGSWLDGVLVRPSQLDRIAAGEAPTLEFWNAFWSVIDDARAGLLDAIGITGRVASLASLLPASLRDRAEKLARNNPKIGMAAQPDMPRRLDLEELSRQPQDSLGGDFHRLIVDNKFDLEVLDREAIGLAQLPPALRFLNTRILQMHDVWHLVGGFRTTALHEIAISAFQLAQFGHGYSAMFLATVAATTSFGETGGAPVLLQTMAEGWRHGRTSPNFMAIDWEREWQFSVADIRARHGITAFTGTYPADLFEQAHAAA